MEMMVAFLKNEIITEVLVGRTRLIWLHIPTNLIIVTAPTLSIQRWIKLLPILLMFRSGRD